MARPTNPHAPALVTSRRDRRALPDNDLEFQLAYVSLALTAARADKKAAIDALSFQDEATWGDTISPVTAKVHYLEQVMGRIEREIKRRSDRNAAVRSRQSEAAKSREVALRSLFDA